LRVAERTSEEAEEKSRRIIGKVWAELISNAQAVPEG
jgi:hypothetical protein